eukprot:CAMPEP_0180666712 /NCGR_PEP_ID=MMETSP1037_2-20121125/61960_1 /TAXON_ID=632150 /ORGANISM="Azadinium spinosum, Strain 3D9" /LENGTH=126 /DNA_ID=CAMNT_0022695237 /DNA_START=58 /DNA_END=435 /DNA_ORIENTATION=+
MGVSFMATSLITGVISESLVNVKEQDPWYKLEQIEESRWSCQTQLIELLSEMDTSGDGYIQPDELHAAEELSNGILSILEAHGINTSFEDLGHIAQLLIENSGRDVGNDAAAGSCHGREALGDEAR